MRTTTKGLLTLAAALALAGCSGSSGSSGLASTAPGSTGTASVTSLQAVGAPVVTSTVTLVYRLVAPSVGTVDIDVDLSTDGGSTWRPATDAPGPDGRTALLTGTGLGAEHVYRWDSAADVLTVSPALLRVTPQGGTGQTTTQLFVDNQPPTPGLIARQPYLQNTTTSSVTVVWRSAYAAESIVEYGETPALGRVAGSFGANVIDHAVEITGLQSGTTYWYRVNANQQPATVRLPFETAPLPGSGTEVSFLAFGDSGTASPEQYALGARMATEDADFVLHTGDLVYPSGGLPNPIPEYDLRVFKPYEDLFRLHPFFPATGNHDAKAAFVPFQSAFFLPDHGGSDVTRELYYSFTWGDAKIVVLETTLLHKLPFGEPYHWLVNELSSNTSKWLIVVGHHPLYSHRGTEPGLVPTLEPLFETYGVDLVLAGHDHDYERSLPVKQYNTDPNYPGLIHVITGGGGATLDAQGTPGAFTDKLVSAFHYTKVRIDGDWLYLDAIDLNGNVIDSFALQNQ